MYVYPYIYFLELANTNTVAAPTKVASPKLIAELLAANFLSFSSNIANFDSSVRKTSPMDEDEVEDSVDRILMRHGDLSKWAGLGFRVKRRR